jgi:hypothetical protein
VFQNKYSGEAEDNRISTPTGKLMPNPSFLPEVCTRFPGAPGVRQSIGNRLSFPETLRPSSWLAWHELAPCKFRNRPGASR